MSDGTPVGGTPCWPSLIREGTRDWLFSHPEGVIKRRAWKAWQRLLQWPKWPSVHCDHNDRCMCWWTGGDRQPAVSSTIRHERRRHLQSKNQSLHMRTCWDFPLKLLIWFFKSSPSSLLLLLFLPKGIEATCGPLPPAAAWPGRNWKVFMHSWHLDNSTGFPIILQGNWRVTFYAQCAALTVSMDAFLMRCWNTALVNCLQTETLMGPPSVYVPGNNIKAFCSDKQFITSICMYFKSHYMFTVCLCLSTW